MLRLALVALLVISMRVELLLGFVHRLSSLGFLLLGNLQLSANFLLASDVPRALTPMRIAPRSAHVRRTFGQTGVARSAVGTGCLKLLRSLLLLIGRRLLLLLELSFLSSRLLRLLVSLQLLGVLLVLLLLLLHTLGV